MRWLWCSLVCACALTSAHSASIEESARRLMADYGASVVPITAVLKIETPGAARGSQERPLEFFGTVVAPNGLTVVSATALAPLSNIGSGLETGGIRPTTSASQIKIRLTNGTEVGARQVFTDEELDLTFLLPEPEDGRSAPEFPRPVVFSVGVEADVLDELITLGRAGDLFNWAPVVGRKQIIGRIENPRRMYLYSSSYSGGVGTPVFTTDGQPFGLVVVRREPAAPRPGRSVPFQQALVILPAEDLAEMVDLALKAALSANP